MTKSITAPKFLQAAVGSGPAEKVGPWAQHAQALDDLRKQIDLERNPLKRDALIQQHTALLVKAERERMAKSLLALTPPLTFAQRIALRRRLKEIPDFIDCLIETVADIIYPTNVTNRDGLLAQSFAEFTAAVFDAGGPLGDTTAAKAFRTELKKALGERIAALDREIRDLEKAIDAERDQTKRQPLKQRIATLKREREPLLAEKQKQHPGSDSKTPRAM